MSSSVYNLSKLDHHKIYYEVLVKVTERKRQTGFDLRGENSYFLTPSFRDQISSQTFFEVIDN